VDGGVIEMEETGVGYIFDIGQPDWNPFDEYLF
jgi:hypothetical protein